MSQLIAGVEIPDTEPVAEATQIVQEMTSPLIFHHSRRVFVFAALKARELGFEVDPELLYMASIFHDTGLSHPFSVTQQRFELDGADHARKFLLDRGFSNNSADTVWTAIALHATPGIPERMGPLSAVTHMGVLVDIFGMGLSSVDPEHLNEITAVHPRDNFKQGFLQSFADGNKNRPDTAHGTPSADVLAEFDPEYRRVTMVELVNDSPWAE